jgi:hypothetical protein
LNAADLGPAKLGLAIGTGSDMCVLEENMPLTITGGGVVSRDWNFVDQRCLTIWHVRECVIFHQSLLPSPSTNTIADVKAYGILGLTNTTSTFNQSGEIVNLTAPALNIEPAYWPYLAYHPIWNGYSTGLIDELVPERNWVVPGVEKYGISYPDDAIYTLNGTNSILTLAAMEKLGNCQQTATYKWGFSFLLLFVVLILFMVWILGTYVLWLDAYLNSRLDIVKRDMGLYRAVLDISNMIQGDLDIHVDPMTPNDVLEKRIKGDKNAGIGLQHLNDALPSNTRMMDFQAWGRAGGYSRWKPRSSLAGLLVLILVITMLNVNFYLGPMSMIWLMSLLVVLVFINILILGRSKGRGLRRPTSNSNISHHPLQSFDDDHPPSASRTCVSEATIDGASNNEPDMDRVELVQPSKIPAPITAVETT